MAKIERKYMAHYIDAAAPATEPGTPKYVRIGKDLEEYSPEMSADVQKTKNILGETSVLVASYEKSGSVEPYYAEKGDPLFDRLQAIVDGGLVLDACNTTVVEVHMWEEKQTNGLPRREGRRGDRGEQLRRRRHRLPDPLHPALQRGAGGGFFDPSTNTFSTEAGT